MSRICPTCERVYEDEHIFCAADGAVLRTHGSGDDLIGNVIDDRYVITSLLGEGGMGRVYLGTHVHLPRKVAIKVLHARLTDDPAAVARFNREATSTSRIEHERVARVFDFGRVAGGATYLAMEYIPGRTLTAVLEQEGALSPARVAILIGQIAEGLGAAHRLDIVHRDLKPDNVLIMLDPDGRECVKIVDFGIAKAIGPADDGTTLTAPGYVTGTPEYMSPEQLLGQLIDRRSDVFALGLLAFRMLTNTLPFDPPTLERGFSAILTDAPRALAEAAPAKQWSTGMQAVFDRVLVREVDRRYPTAAAFASALHDAVAESETSGARVHGAPTIHAQGRQVPGTPGIGGGGVAVADAFAERVPASKSRRWMAPALGGVALLVVASIVVLVRLDRASVSRDLPSAGASSTPDRVAPVATAPSSPVAASAPAEPPGAAPTTRAPTRARPAALSGVPARVGSSTDATPGPPRGSTLMLARIDSIRDGLDALLLADNARDTPSRATALVARLDDLLPNAPPADSARVLLLKANLLTLTGDHARACSTLAQARARAATVADRNSVKRYSELWSC